MTTTEAAFPLGNRVEDPLQKVGSSSPVVVCQNIATLLLQHCWMEVWMWGGGLGLSPEKVGENELFGAL